MYCDPPIFVMTDIMVEQKYILLKLGFFCVLYLVAGSHTTGMYVRITSYLLYCRGASGIMGHLRSFALVIRREKLLDAVRC